MPHPSSLTANSSKPTVSRLTPEQEITVEQNIPLVHHIVARMTENFPAADERDDLIQAGLVGLIEATQRFDPELGYTFSTFAGRRIEGAVLDLLRRQDWAPRSVRRNERQMQEADTILTAALGRKPSPTELGRQMGVAAEQVHAIRADVAQARVNSIFSRRRMSEDDASVLDIDVPAAEGGPHPDDVEHNELMGYLRDGIRLLPERHRLVITGHFLEGRSMTELGELLGVTQSRASQLKSEALSMLKGGLDKHLEDTEDPTATRRQHAYNEALGQSSSWRDRLQGSDRLTVV
jgi:RNA polymerase sigma factor for flagellar operon FliA